MPAVFSSKNMPSYSALNTSTFRPRASKYSRSFSRSRPSAASSDPCQREAAATAATARETRIERLLIAVLRSTLMLPRRRPPSAALAFIGARVARGRRGVVGGGRRTEQLGEDRPQALGPDLK